MKIHAITLEDGQLLRATLEEVASERGIRAGFVITCVGAIKHAVMRMPGSTPDHPRFTEITDPHEIISLAGTIALEGVHLHMSVSNTEGHVIGGHLQEADVHLSAELVLGEIEDLKFDRVFSDATGYNELQIQPSNSGSD